MAVTHPHPNRLAWRRLSQVYRALRRNYSAGFALEVAAETVAIRLPRSAEFAERAAPLLPRAYEEAPR